MRAVAFFILFTSASCVCVYSEAQEASQMIWKLPRDTLLILDHAGCGEDTLDGGCTDLAFDCDMYADDQRGQVMISAPISELPKQERIPVKLRVSGSRNKTFAYDGRLDPYSMDAYLVLAETNVGDDLFEIIAREKSLTLSLGRERREVPLAGIAAHLPYFLAACAGLSS
jgi:hypothetical protein